MTIKLFILLLCSLFGSSFDKEPALASQEQVVYAVIVHIDSKIDDLSLSDLKKYMKVDRRHWPDKSSVILFQRPLSSALQKYMLEEIYGMTERQLRRHFVSLMNKGSIGAIPSVVKEREMVCRLVGKKDGGLAVVVAGDLPKTVKALKIDGKSPGEKGYPLVQTIVQDS
jgi:hypothetical protein